MSQHCLPQSEAAPLRGSSRLSGVFANARIPNANRIPGLDGLRALSILLVLAGHIAGTRHAYKTLFWGQLGDLSNLGVRVFFVISGYLITMLLLKEHRKTGRISIKDFYFRRTVRIFPAFYFFLVVLTVCSALGAVELMRGDLLHAYTYSINFFPDSRSWWVGHIWSLSVEEQFYLLWPSVLVLLGLRRGLSAAFWVVMMAPVCRIMIYIWWPQQRALIGEAFPTIADTIAIGCLLAGFKERILAHPIFRKFIESGWFAVIPVITLLLNIEGRGRIRFGVIETLVNLGIALCICRVTTITDGIFSRLLNSGSLVFIGTLSYSLYLWQQLFLNRYSTHWTAAFPQNLILAFVAALVCHYAVEKPFLALRDRKWTKPLPSTRISSPQ